VANSSDGTLSRIDPVTGTVAATIALGAGTTDVTAGLGAVWVSDETGYGVFRVDPHSDQVTASIRVGTGPTALAGGFGSVWVANSLDGTVFPFASRTAHGNLVAGTLRTSDRLCPAPEIRSQYRPRPSRMALPCCGRQGHSSSVAGPTEMCLLRSEASEPG
jgi:hypothetical protein